MPAPGASHKLKGEHGLTEYAVFYSFHISQSKGLKHPLLQTNSFFLTAGWLQTLHTVCPPTPPHPSLAHVKSQLILPIYGTFEWLGIFCLFFGAHAPPTQGGKPALPARFFS